MAMASSIAVSLTSSVGSSAGLSPLFRNAARIEGSRVAHLRRSSLLPVLRTSFALHSSLMPSETKPVSVRAAVGADSVVTEPTTSIKFATSLTLPESSTTLSFLGAGVREKQIALLKVKVYAVGIYADSGIAAAALAPWRGKSADELAQDETMYQKLVQAPVEKALQIKLAREVDGATFWGALDEALVPRLKGKAADGALSAFGDVFKNRSLKKGCVIVLCWVQPSTFKIAVAESDAAQVSMEASINSEALVSALYDVFLGPNAVSPPANSLWLRASQSSCKPLPILYICSSLITFAYTSPNCILCCHWICLHMHVDECPSPFSI